MILESPVDSKEIKPVNPKGNQSWIFTGRTDAEAEAPILWPPDVKSWLIRKDLDAGKDWRQKGMTEDEVIGWHHWLNGHESEQALVILKDREAWRAAVHGVAKSRTWLSDWTTTKASGLLNIWGLFFFNLFLFGCTGSYLWHASAWGKRDLVPRPGLRYWESPGPPEKSLLAIFGKSPGLRIERQTSRNTGVTLDLTSEYWVLQM